MIKYAELGEVLYDDFSELKQERPELAEELLEQFGKGEWQNGLLYVYDDLASFARYELTEGWYVDNHLDKEDYNGAPNPLDYIDLEGLGDALYDTWDDSCHYLSDTNEVITSEYGW